jgi:hypothetical protein
MRYLFLLFLFSYSSLSLGLASNPNEVCKFDYRHESPSGSATTSSDCKGFEVPPGANYTAYCQATGSYYNDGAKDHPLYQLYTISLDDCGNTPNDDSGEDGCYSEDANADGYCPGEKKNCSSNSGMGTFKLEASKNCSDYCLGANGGNGSVHLCTGSVGDSPLGEYRGDCPLGQIMGSLGCETDPNYPPECPAGLSWNNIIKACGCNDPNGCSGDDDSGDDDNNNGDDGSDGGDDDSDDSDDGSDGDDSSNVDENFPEHCNDAAKAEICYGNPAYVIRVLDVENCTLICDPVSNPGDDSDPPDTGDGDSGSDDGDDNSGGDSGSGDDNDDDSSSGGGDPDPAGDPMDIEGFESLEERVSAKRTEYMEKLDEYRGKFNELFDFNPGSGGSPFSDDIITVMGVDINFGTSRFEPFLAFLPALILFAATCYAAFLVMSGGSK